MRYTSEEINAMWIEFLSQTDYGKALLDIQEQYPSLKSLFIKFDDIVGYNAEFAEDFLDNPEEYIAIGELAMRSYGETDVKVHLRVIQIPEHDRVKEIRRLRTTHLNKFVSIRGIIRRATEIRPKLKIGAFKCSDCGEITKVEQEGAKLIEPDKCSVCGKPRGKVKFKLLLSESYLEDSQVIEIQDMPEDLRGGEQPQRITAILEDDLAGEVVPGDRIILNGILKARETRIQNVKSTEFIMYMYVNSIDREDNELESLEDLSEEDIKEIKELARNGDVIEKIRQSIAPAIFDTGPIGMIKEALVLQMFGGVAKKMPDGTKIRGDIHILLVGDPGTAKSQLLQRMSQLVPHGIYTSGKGSSAAGLTATAVKDETGRWTLEAGALVLADLGLAAIDEIDKMSTIDRDSIYQAMEQQIISVTKAGIYATLMSRCSVLGAANPKYGRFDPRDPLPEQIDLPIPLLSRFDVIFKIMDIPEEKQDREMADYILNVHLVGEKIILGEEDILVEQHTQKIPPEMIKKYVKYAKSNIVPKLSDEAIRIIESEFLRIRGKFKEDYRVSITPRQLEAMVRLAEASARARLSDVVTENDARRAVRIIRAYLTDVASEDGVIDIDSVYTGITKKKRDNLHIIKEIISDLESEDMATERNIIIHAESMGLKDRDEIIRLIEMLRRKGEIYIDTNGGYKIVGH